MRTAIEAIRAIGIKPQVSPSPGFAAKSLGQPSPQTPVRSSGDCDDDDDGVDDNDDDGVDDDGGDDGDDDDDDGDDDDDDDLGRDLA
jgi:hypothetical protein